MKNREFIFGSAENPFNGRKMLLLILGFFGTIIAVNGIFVWFALSSWTGLETEKPYEKGLNYNDTLKAAAAQQARAWRLRDDIVPLGDGNYQLTVTATDKTGSPLAGLAVSARLRRPTQADMDFTVTAEAAGNGRYIASFQVPALGNWDLFVLAANAAGENHRKERRLWLK